MALSGPYSWAAPLYDALSLEWPVYRAGRVAGVQALALASGARVLDVGCGTGLSFPLLQDAMGDDGRIVGVDASAQMLRQAGRRGRRGGKVTVVLTCGDATALNVGAVRDLLGPAAERPPGADAVLFCYSLSLMSPWQAAWAHALDLARPGARIAVVDMGLPGGRARVLGPLARLACAAGGSDISAHPWAAVERELLDVCALSLRGGHIQVRAGTVPGDGYGARG